MTQKPMMMGVAAAATMPPMTDTETIGGYTWTYRINGDTAEIYGSYNSLRRSCTSAISPRPNGIVTIPSSLGGKTVTSIGDYAFFGCSGLTSVAIPDSVTGIGRCAFYDCSRLASVTIPDSVTSIGDYAFYWCYALKSVTISDSVTSIGSYAFFDSGLTRVTIPDSVTSIGEGAFYNCNGLTSAKIGKGVKSIGRGMFLGCERLTSVIFEGDEPGGGSGLSLTLKCTVYVHRDSTGWGVRIPGTWNGIHIAYLD